MEKLGSADRQETTDEKGMPDREKLSYDAKINALLRSLRRKYNEIGLSLDTRYMDYFGDNCPMCEGPIKVKRGIVENAASVSSYLLLEQNKAVAYCICRSCAKKLTRFRTDNLANQTEAAIIAKLPDLKRSRQPTKEEIYQEREILKKLF